MNKCIINGKIILKDKIVEKNIFFNNEKILEISSRSPLNEEVIDAKGLYVSPGFIDIHTHGRGGSDTMYPNFNDINTISKTAIVSGVTSFLPTTMTMGIEDTLKAYNNVIDSIEKVEGSKILGVHMEGPFINIKNKGAQPGQYVIEPTMDNLNALTNNNLKYVKKITVAPEIPKCLDLISELNAKGISVSMGHTCATYEEAIQGILAGANSGTHTYNAMTGLNHRNPGMVGAIMDHDDVYAELILDGIHVSFPSARILLKTKGLDKLCLITDSMEAAGLPDGKYSLGGQDVFVKENFARLADGTLAGSVLSMNKAVYNAWKNLNIELYQAVQLASYNPALSIHNYDIGELALNKKPDIILFDDEVNVKEVYIDGNRRI